MTKLSLLVLPPVNHQPKSSGPSEPAVPFPSGKAALDEFHHKSSQGHEQTMHEPVFDHHRVTTTAHHCPLLPSTINQTIVNQLLTVLNHYKPVSATINYCQPLSLQCIIYLLTSINQWKPFSTRINHHHFHPLVKYPLSTIISHSFTAISRPLSTISQPLSTIVNHYYPFSTICQPLSTVINHYYPFSTIS